MYNFSMAFVIIRSGLDYDYASIKPIVHEIMDKAGLAAIKKESRVVIKPNLLAAAPPEKAMTTHPLVVRAAAEYVLEKGAVPQISDSPALGGFDKILKESGIRDALKGLDVNFKEFRESAIVETLEPFRRLELARDALEADFLINLPKLKTHQQMLLTLGVKNLFGSVVGFKKPEWHFRTGIDRDIFAKLLVLIHAALKPSATIIDGILAMEGQGPGRSGRPKKLGVLLGSDSAVSLDHAVCRMLGLAPEDLLTNKTARELGFPGDFELDGELPQIRDFKLPRMSPLVFGPKAFHGFLRSHLVERPVPDEDICKLCGECWKYCPAKAITKGEKAPVFDYEKCIRCYCCIEVCPHAALSAKETLPGRLIKSVIKRRK